MVKVRIRLPGGLIVHPQHEFRGVDLDFDAVPPQVICPGEGRGRLQLHLPRAQVEAHLRGLGGQLVTGGYYN